MSVAWELTHAVLFPLWFAQTLQDPSLALFALLGMLHLQAVKEIASTSMSA